MKYNQHFKEARGLFEQYGVDSVWSKGEGLSGREQTLIASVCWYLEQLFPLHEENILKMHGQDVVEYMNKTLGTDFTGKSTVSEGFAGWHEVLAKMYIKQAHQAL